MKSIPWIFSLFLETDEEAPLRPMLLPSITQSHLPSRFTTCGTRLLYLAGARDVQRSYHSETWVSASTTGMPESRRVAALSRRVRVSLIVVSSRCFRRPSYARGRCLAATKADD